MQKFGLVIFSFALLSEVRLFLLALDLKTSQVSSLHPLKAILLQTSAHSSMNVWTKDVSSLECR